MVGKLPVSAVVFQPHLAPKEQRTVVADVSSRQAKGHWNVQGREVIPNDLFCRPAKGKIVVVHIGQASDHNAFQSSKQTRTAHTLEHAVHVVEVLIDLLDKENSALHIGQIRTSKQTVQHTEVAPFQDPFGSSDQVIFAAHPFLVNIFTFQGPECLFPRLRRAIRKIHRHGAMQALDIQLMSSSMQDGDVAVAADPFGFLFEKRIVDAIHHAHAAIAPSNRENSLDLFIRQHPVEGCTPRSVLSAKLMEGAVCAIIYSNPEFCFHKKFSCFLNAFGI